jgi:hypothetical protein
MEDDEMESSPAENGLFCFIDHTRPCGADCMAYTTNPSESPVLNIQQKNCSLLVTADRLSRGVQWLVQINRKSREDEERRNAPKPPDPRGGMQ